MSYIRDSIHQGYLEHIITTPHGQRPVRSRPDLAGIRAALLTVVHWPLGPWFNIKMTSYQYKKSHCGDKTVVRLSYLPNGIFYLGKTSSLYWIRAQASIVFHDNLWDLTCRQLEGWVYTQQCGYWWPGAKAPGHQYPHAWLNMTKYSL